MENIKLTITFTATINPEILSNFYDFDNKEEDIPNLTDNELEQLFLDIPAQELMEYSENYNYMVEVHKEN